MSSWTSSGDPSAASAALTAPDVQASWVLHSSSSSYKVLDFIGEGSFGQIFKSQNLRTKEVVAVKIPKKDTENEDINHEVAILKVISKLDSDHNNLIKFHEQFQHMEQTCLVFEMMDMNLYDLLEQREGKPLTLHEIRPVGKQLLVALDALKRFGVLHTDIKPDNIMFVNMQDQPLRLKLIDFGCALMASQVELGMDVQPYGYRAPEIALGLPFTEAIDVWGVGCVLAFLYLAQNLFHVDCKYQMMNSMVAVLGQPEDHLLRAGKYSQQFFIEEEAGATSSWRLMTAEEFTVANHMCPEKPDLFINGLTSLNDLIHIHPKSDAIEMEDRRAFVSLLGALLHFDGDERISPRQALQQPFISMSHLRQDVNSGDYLTTSKTAMRVNPTEDRVACAASDCGYFETELSGSMDTDSWCSDEAQDSASAPRSSFRVVNTSDTDSWCSDEAQDSASAPRSSFRVVNTSDTDSWCFECCSTKTCHLTPILN